MNTLRGAQQGDTNALKHTRFTNLATATAQYPGARAGPLIRHLQLLAAVIEDLANQDILQPAFAKGIGGMSTTRRG